MIIDGRVLGLPLVNYAGAQADIAAITLALADAGALAYASDTAQWGVWDGAAWLWSLPGVFGAPYDLDGVNSIQFDTTPSTLAHTEGQVHWDADDGTLEIDMPGGAVHQQIGLELFAGRAKNESGAAILNGTVVYVSGGTGANPLISPADPDDVGTAIGIGMATEDIADGHFGYVTAIGLVRDVNTAGYPAGTVLWLADDGGYTDAMPGGSAFRVVVGQVIREHADEGVIFAKIDIIPRLTSLTGVNVGDSETGDLLQLQGDGTWENASPDVAVWPYTGAINQEPGGFVDPENVGVSYDYTTRKVTLTHSSGSIVYYVAGVRYALSSPWTSDAHAATAGAWYLYDAGAGPVWGSSIWAFYYAQFCYVNYNSPAGAYFGLRECHGLMGWETHREFHEATGTYRRAGGAPTAGTYTLQPASPTDADNTPGFDAAVVADEDLPTAVGAWTQGTYTHLYFSGSGTVVFNTAASLLTRTGSTYPLINVYAGGTFTDTETATGRFFNVYQILLPAAADTESQKYRILILQPQAVYNSLAAAQAEDYRALYLGGLTALAPEFVAYTRITLGTSASYSGATGRCRIEALAYLVGPKATQTISGGVIYGQATETTLGVIELATTAEAQAGTDTERAVTPAGLRADVPATPAASRGVRLDANGDLLLPSGGDVLPDGATDVDHGVDKRLRDVSGPVGVGDYGYSPAQILAPESAWYLGVADNSARDDFFRSNYGGAGAAIWTAVSGCTPSSVTIERPSWLRLFAPGAASGNHAIIQASITHAANDEYTARLMPANLSSGDARVGLVVMASDLLTGAAWWYTYTASTQVFTLTGATYNSANAWLSQTNAKTSSVGYTTDWTTRYTGTAFGVELYRPMTIELKLTASICRFIMYAPLYATYAALAVNSTTFTLSPAYLYLFVEGNLASGTNVGYFDFVGKNIFN